MTLLKRSINALIAPSKQNTERPPLSLGSGLNISGISGGIAAPNQLSQMQAMSATSWLFAVVDRISA